MKRNTVIITSLFIIFFVLLVRHGIIPLAMSHDMQVFATVVAILLFLYSYKLPRA